jgi:hypothetical protein
VAVRAAAVRGGTVVRRGAVVRGGIGRGTRVAYGGIRRR